MLDTFYKGNQLTVGARIPNAFGIRMVQSHSDVEWLGFWMVFSFPMVQTVLYIDKFIVFIHKMVKASQKFGFPMVQTIRKPNKMAVILFLDHLKLNF